MKLISISSGCVLVALFLHGASTQSSDPPSSQTVTDDSAAAKAAARKRRFEEEKRRLEGGDHSASSDPNQTFFVSPVKVNLLVGQSQPFCAFDLDGKTLTSEAEWTISSSSSIATLTRAGGPLVMAKGLGTLTIRARVGTRDAEAEITVLAGPALTPGTVRWSAPNIPGFKIERTTPAVPSPNGPDVYLQETNSAGETLIRALTSDGVQLWMRRSAEPVKKIVAH